MEVSDLFSGEEFITQCALEFSFPVLLLFLPTFFIHDYFMCVTAAHGNSRVTLIAKNDQFSSLAFLKIVVKDYGILSNSGLTWFCPLFNLSCEEGVLWSPLFCIFFVRSCENSFFFFFSEKDA